MQHGGHETLEELSDVRLRELLTAYSITQPMSTSDSLY